MRSISLIASLFVVVNGDDVNKVVVTTKNIPPGCELPSDVDSKPILHREVLGCNRKKTITKKVKIEQCEGTVDRWHVTEDLTELETLVKVNDRFFTGRYLNLTNVQNCRVHLIKSCSNATDLGWSSCGDDNERCELDLPVHDTKAPAFDMTCPDKRTREVEGFVSETFYIWDPAPLPPPTYLHFYIEPTDAKDEKNPCADAEIKKPECSRLNTWETIREKCSIVKNDDLFKKPSCGYKLVARLWGDANAVCMNYTGDVHKYYPLLWNFEDTEKLALLEHFTLDRVMLTDDKYAENCTIARWLEATKYGNLKIDNDACVAVRDDQNAYKAALKKNGNATADFASQHIPFGKGGLFTFGSDTSRCGKKMPGYYAPYFKTFLKWTRLTK